MWGSVRERFRSDVDFANSNWEVEILWNGKGTFQAGEIVSIPQLSFRVACTSRFITCR